MEFWFALLTSPTVLIAAVIIGTVGEVVKRSVMTRERTHELRVWRETRPMPLLARNRPKGTPEIVPGPLPPKPALWVRIYYNTLPAHPVVMGLLIALIPWLPAAESLTKEGFELAGRVGTYGLAGVVCKIGYDSIISTMRRTIGGDAPTGGSAAGAPSSVPPTADSDGEGSPPA